MNKKLLFFISLVLIIYLTVLIYPDIFICYADEGKKIVKNYISDELYTNLMWLLQLYVEG